jgi:cytochrome c2
MKCNSIARCSIIAAGLFLIAALPALADDAGKKEFQSQECNKCHSVKSQDIVATLKVEKMHGPDMSEVGTRRDVATIKQIVLREIPIEGHDHKGKWKGNDKQLEVIANWLASLK